MYSHSIFQVPFVCDTCGTIAEEDIYLENQLCKKCNISLTIFGEIDGTELIPGIDFYDYSNRNPQLVRNIISDKRRNYRFDRKSYKCPCYKIENLEFTKSGCWD